MEICCLIVEIGVLKWNRLKSVKTWSIEISVNETRLCCCKIWLCKTVLCETVLCETVFFEIVLCKTVETGVLETGRFQSLLLVVTVTFLVGSMSESMVFKILGCGKDKEAI